MSRLERDLENPTVGLLDRVAKALSAHISEFFIEHRCRQVGMRTSPRADAGEREIESELLSQNVLGQDPGRRPSPASYLVTTQVVLDSSRKAQGFGEV
jgi:transcriptional regulator with XRE-family HTH domain